MIPFVPSFLLLRLKPIVMLLFICSSPSNDTTVNSFSEGIWSVSYTHLDVYKRQTLPYKPAIADDGRAKEADIQPIAAEKDKLTILIAEDNDSNYKLFASISVSYTHLDVYKRQAVLTLRRTKMLCTLWRMARCTRWQPMRYAAACLLYTSRCV